MNTNILILKLFLSMYVKKLSAENLYIGDDYSKKEIYIIIWLFNCNSAIQTPEYISTEILQSASNTSI